MVQDAWRKEDLQTTIASGTVLFRNESILNLKLFPDLMWLSRCALNWRAFFYIIEDSWLLKFLWHSHCGQASSTACHPCTEEPLIHILEVVSTQMIRAKPQVMLGESDS